MFMNMTLNLLRNASSLGYVHVLDKTVNISSVTLANAKQLPGISSK